MTVWPVLVHVWHARLWVWKRIYSWSGIKLLNTYIHTHHAHAYVFMCIYVHIETADSFTFFLLEYAHMHVSTCARELNCYSESQKKKFAPNLVAMTFRIKWLSPDLKPNLKSLIPDLRSRSSGFKAECLIPSLQSDFAETCFVTWQR